MNHKKLDYLIKLTFDKEYQGYVADVVNLYGCMSQGKTREEALENAEKAIKAYMEALNLKKDQGSEYTKRTVDTLVPPVITPFYKKVKHHLYQYLYTKKLHLFC